MFMVLCRFRVKGRVCFGNLHTWKMKQVKGLKYASGVIDGVTFAGETGVEFILEVVS